MVPPLSHKLALFTNLGQSLSKKVSFVNFMNQFYNLAF